MIGFRVRVRVELADEQSSGHEVCRDVDFLIRGEQHDGHERDHHGANERISPVPHDRLGFPLLDSAKRAAAERLARRRGRSGQWLVSFNVAGAVTRGSRGAVTHDTFLRYYHRRRERNLNWRVER